MHLPPQFARRYGPWALVTGSSSGIGDQFVRQLAAAGLNIVLTARRVDRLQALSQHITTNFPIQTRVIPADLSTPEGWKAIIAKTEDLSIRLLVANAGFEVHGSFFRASATRYLEMISLHCSAVTVLTHTFGLKMVEAGRGGIILVSSIAAEPLPWWAVYSSTKAFITNFGLILRNELQPLGVDVMVLEPGLVKSEMSDAVGATMDFKKMGLVVQPAEECVRCALKAFTSGQARTTPGLLNRFFFFINQILPTSWAISLGRFMHGMAMDQSLTKF